MVLSVQPVQESVILYFEHFTNMSQDMSSKASLDGFENANLAPNNAIAKTVVYKVPT